MYSFCVQPFTAVLTTNGIVVPSQSEADSLHQDGYGSQNRNLLKLTLNETLYHLDRGKIIVLDENRNQKMTFQEVYNIFSSKEPELMLKFVVYKDLRTRGFVVQQKDSHFFEVYERGEFRKLPPKYLVIILSEGESKAMKDIQEILENVSLDEMQLKLAVLDRRGEVVYYSLNEISL